MTGARSSRKTARRMTKAQEKLFDKWWLHNGTSFMVNDEEAWLAGFEACTKLMRQRAAKLRKEKR